MISWEDISAARSPFAAFVVVGFAWGGFAAQVPLLKAQSGASDGAFGLVMLLAAFGAVCAMWIAPLADRFLNKRAMVLFAAILALAFIPPGAARNVTLLGLTMLLASAASGTLDVIMNARLSGIEARRDRPLMNFGHAVFSFAYAIAALIAGFAREAGWPPFATFALLGAMSLALCTLVAQDKDGADQAVKPAAAQVPQALLWLGGAIILVAFMAEQATEQWSALHLERSLSAGAMEGAFGPAVLGLTMGIGRMSGQIMVHHLSEISVIIVASLVAAFGAVLAAMATGLDQAYWGFALLGLGVSVVAPMAYAYIGRRMTPELRTFAIARISVIGYSGFFIGPPIMGFLAEGFGLIASFLFVGLSMAMIAFLLAPVLSRVERKDIHPC